MFLRNLCSFSGCLVGKTRENDKVRHMTQISSLLAVATVFVALWTQFYSQGGGGAYIHETKASMQELELKCRGLCTWGRGVIAGFYGIIFQIVFACMSCL